MKRPQPPESLKRTSRLALMFLAPLVLAGCAGTTTPQSSATSTATPTGPNVYITVAPRQPNGDAGASGVGVFDATTGARRFTYGGTGSFIVEAPPAVADGAGYAGTADVSSGQPQDSVAAFDPHTGAIRWRTPVDGWVWRSPTVVGGVVYATTAPLGSPDGRSVYALRASDGALLWRFVADGGMEGAPVVADGVVYVSTGYMYALRADTGKLLWRSASLVGIATAAVAVADGVVYAGGGGDTGVVSALRASDGAILWRTQIERQIDGGLIVANGSVYIGTSVRPSVGQTGPEEAFLYALDAATGKVSWRYTVSAPIDWAPVAGDGLVYFGDRAPDNALYALDAATGALKWRYQPPIFVGLTCYPAVNQPALNDGAIYFVAQCSEFGQGVPTSQIALHALNAGDGSLRWVTPNLNSLGHFTEPPLVIAP